MMMKSKLTILAVALGLPAAALSLGAGTSNADFTKLGVGARPAAMGEAFAAVADDSNSNYWNPAGLALAEKGEITLMHMAHIADISYDTLSLAYPTSRYSGIGFSAAYLWQPPFDSTVGAQDFGVAVNNEAGTGSDLAVALSYAHNFGNYRTTDFNISNISAGATVRLVSRTLQDKNSSTLLMDVGGIAEIFEGFRMGLMLQNFGTATSFINAADNAPMNAKLGMSYLFAFGEGDQHGLRLAYDVNHPIDTENPEYQRWRQNVGMEFQVFNSFALRGGYKFGVDTGGLTAGAGFRFGAMGVDYAFVPFSELGDSHRVSANIRFGNLMPRPEISAPDQPRALSAIAGDKLVSLAWEANREDDVVGYNVYYTKTSGRNYVRTNEKPEPRQTSLKVRLKNDVQYFFVVTAVNAAGKESEFSSEVNVVPSAPKKPGKPSGLRSRVSGRTVELNWKAVRDKRVVGYHVYYSKTKGGQYRRLTKGAPLGDAECKLRGLSPGKDYYFVITAITREGLESDYSSEVTARPAVGAISQPPVKKKRSDERKPKGSVLDQSF